MISSHQGKKGIKIFFPSITPVFSLWNKARLSTDLTRNCALSEVFHLLDSRSLIWTIAASGKKSLVRGYFKPSKTKLTRGPCSVIPHPPYPRPPQHLPAAGSDDLGRLWPGLPDTLEVYRRFLFPSGAFCLELGWMVSRLPLSDHFWPGNLLCHISHVFWIQMLWSKLSSELRLNHPSFSINTRAQLPAQLLRYFELKFCLS